MKMNKKLIVLVALVLAVVITGYSVSGTYAKYTSTFTGTESVNIAKWGFDGEKATLDVDLFKSSTYENVSSGTIAPGTKGSYAITLANVNQVFGVSDVDYTITPTVEIKDGTNGRIQFWLGDVSTDKASADKVYRVGGESENDLSDLQTAIVNLIGTKTVKAGSSADAYSIGSNNYLHWEWEYSESEGAKDGDDTTAGINSAKATTTASITINLTATQNTPSN